jgi:UDP-N-acetylglucosamine acyltransferase
MNKHPLSVIHPDAKLADSVVVSPFVTISKDVVIGEGTWIGPGAHIMDGARIGKDCKIFPGAIVSADPQDLKYRGENTLLEIGDNTIIREYCTLNKGTIAAGKTVIGSNCLLMAYVHVAHDCFIGNNCILANNVNLAGHIEIEDYAILGGLAAVHQFVKIGQHAFIGGGSLVTKDVPPYVKASREPLSYVGVNTTGLKRRGFTAAQTTTIQNIYRILFVKGYNLKKAMEIIDAEIMECDEKDEIMHFIRTAERGIMKGFRTVTANKVANKEYAVTAE